MHSQCRDGQRGSSSNDLSLTLAASCGAGLGQIGILATLRRRPGSNWCGPHALSMQRWSKRQLLERPLPYSCSELWRWSGSDRNPRNVEEEAWLKLVWTACTLNAEMVKEAAPRTTSPLLLQRAVALVWVRSESSQR